MGHVAAAGMAEGVADGLASLESALHWHLSSNHYPPVPDSMIAPCIAAIEAGNEDDWERQIELPEGVTWRDETQAPAYAVIESHHLQAFLGGDDE